MTDDIVARLRLYSTRMEESRSTVLGLLLNDAADENERLRAGGCARDQRTTQFCAEAERLRAERDEARVLYLKEICAGFDCTAKQEAEMRGWKGLFP